MSKKNDSSANQVSSFASLFPDAKPITTDTYVPSRKEKRLAIKRKNEKTRLDTKKSHASFEFSDGFEATFSDIGPLKYVRENERSDLVKMIRRGDIQPDLELDLHGFNSETAKFEIAALLHEARKRHYQCVSIVHGVGSGILKRRVPSWLVQHPHVAGFHQAPLEWGGNGALLVLVEQDQVGGKYD